MLKNFCFRLKARDSLGFSSMKVNIKLPILRFTSLPEFVNFYRVPRNRFRQPMLPGGPVLQIGLSYRPTRLGIDSWAPKKVYKFELWIDRCFIFEALNAQPICHKLSSARSQKPTDYSSFSSFFSYEISVLHLTF
jgi:hypothetical protein